MTNTKIIIHKIITVMKVLSTQLKKEGVLIEILIPMNFIRKVVNYVIATISSCGKIYNRIGGGMKKYQAKIDGGN